VQSGLRAAFFVLHEISRYAAMTDVYAHCMKVNAIIKLLHRGGLETTWRSVLSRVFFDKPDWESNYHALR
jgi:hypothetical protein